MSWRYTGSWLILLSFVLAFFLTSIPLPEWIDHFRPSWLSLVLIYWCMVLPHRVGIGTAWLLGLFLDAAKGTPLGQHALALILLAYFTLKCHRLIRVFPLWQQSLTVLVFLLSNQVLISWIDGIVGYPPKDLWYFAPAVSGMLLWPWVFILLRDACLRFQVAS